MLQATTFQSSDDRDFSNSPTQQNITDEHHTNKRGGWAHYHEQSFPGICIISHPLFQKKIYFLFFIIFRFCPSFPKLITDNPSAHLQKLKGQESLGFEYPHKDPGPILSEWPDGGPIGGTCSPTGYQHNSHDDTPIQEATGIHFPGSESTEKSETDQSQMFNRSSMDAHFMDEEVQKALHAAIHKGHLEMEKILPGGANVNKQGARGCTPKAIVEEQENKCINDLLLSYENGRKLEEHRIDLIGPESADNGMYSQSRFRRQGCQSVNSQSKKKPTDFLSTRVNYPGDTDVIKSIKKRVTIHMQLQHNSSSQRQLAKLIILPDSIEELLKIAGKLCLNSKDLK